MNDSKNDIAWQKIFNKYPIIEEVGRCGHFEISATAINEFREARLMTKFDFSSQLPKIFSDNSLSILPISRGSYLIGDFDIFSKFQPSDDISIINKTFPEYIKSIDFKDISSEAVAINCAYISGMFEDFMGEKNILPTLTGRMGSSNFSFKILGKRSENIFDVSVKNAQIEIDGCYEGKESLMLIEAKNVLAEDFIIRQLYYPYRLMIQRLGKEVRPVFLTYSNGIFHIREYTFEKPDVYNSIRLKNYRKYSILDSRLTKEYLLEILKDIKYVEEDKEIPFPQADDFARIINLSELIKEDGPKDKSEIALEYGFVMRQADYYSNAALYLDLLKKEKIGNITYLKLSEYGESIFNKDLKSRQVMFIKAIIKHRPFGESLRKALLSGTIPAKEEIVSIMKNTPDINVTSEQTFARRAQTVASWVRWIANNIER